MSTLLTHAVAGVLIGLALRFRLRHLWIAAFLPMLPDVEKITYFLFDGYLFVTGRSVLHNVFFTIALPLVVYAVLRWRDAPVEWRRIALAAPVLLTSHLLLDIVPLEPYGQPGWALIMYPLTDAWFGPGAHVHAHLSPVTHGAFAMVAGVLFAGVLVTLLAERALEGAEPPAGRAAWWRFGAFASAWVLLVPALIGAGALAYGPPRVDASFTLDAPTFHVVDGAFSTTLRHTGGADAPAGHLALVVTRGDATLVTLTNPTPLRDGDAWDVRAPLDVPDADGLRVTVSMNTEVVPRTYASANVRVDEGYLAADLALVAFEHDGKSHAVLTLENRGAVDVPARALDAGVAASGGRVVANLTNPLSLAAGERVQLTFELPVTRAQEAFRIEVHAAELAHTYLVDARAPELNPLAQAEVPPVAVP